MVKQVNSHFYCFSLRPLKSPTYFNVCKYLQALGWKTPSFGWWADFSEKNFQFDEKVAECLEFKNLLAQLVAQYCPQVMPMTYCINDQNWLSILNQMAHEFYIKDFELYDEIKDLVWILKPATLNNGQHIKVFQRLSQLEAHFISANRLGGEHVLQQYITHPHLLKGPSKGHKYSLRMFVVLTNYAGSFLYPQGYFNVALNPYQPHEFNDLSPHITNEHLSENKSNVVQISTQQYDLFKPFYPRIKSIVGNILMALHQAFPNAFICKKKRTLAIFGFDFLVDINERVWLLEANHGPCFPIHEEHVLQKSLYHDFWQAFIVSFILPIVKKQSPESIQYQLFERIDSDYFNPSSEFL